MLRGITHTRRRSDTRIWHQLHSSCCVSDYLSALLLGSSPTHTHTHCCRYSHTIKLLNNNSLFFLSFPSFLSFPLPSSPLISLFPLHSPPFLSSPGLSSLLLLSSLLSSFLVSSPFFFSCLLCSLFHLISLSTLLSFPSISYPCLSFLFSSPFFPCLVSSLRSSLLHAPFPFTSPLLFFSPLLIFPCLLSFPLISSEPLLSSSSLLSSSIFETSPTQQGGGERD